jgi:hypothetical protein
LFFPLYPESAIDTMKASLSLSLLAAALADAGCPLPKNGYKWKDSGSLATPAHGWTGIKDFSVVPLNNSKHLVLGSSTDSSGNYNSFQFDPVSDWSQLKTANQNPMNTACVAPNTFYFTPKNIWVTAQEWGPAQFSYCTSSDPTNPKGWSGLKPLYNSGNPTGGGNPIDPAVISDGTTMWLFFGGDNGHVYRSSMPVSSFPGQFPVATSILQDSQYNLFEAVQIYKVKDVQQYLLIVECIGTQGRIFRSFTATSLGGTFTAQSGLSTNPFAGAVNSGSSWSKDVSSGDMIRITNDETMQIDGCNLQLFYQGLPPGGSSKSYNTQPWQPGLLTLTNPEPDQGESMSPPSTYRDREIDLLTRRWTGNGTHTKRFNA